jgi:protein KRI1
VKEKFGDVNVQKSLKASSGHGGKGALDFASDDDDEEDSTSEEEDEEGELLTPEVDLQIFNVISKIRAKDQEVYNPDATFFKNDAEDADNSADVKSSKSKKPLTIADYQRQQLLKGNMDGEAENESKTYVEEQDELRAEIKRGFEIDVVGEGDDDEEEEFLSVRPKSDQEKKAEEENYRRFLKSQLEKDKTGDQFFESLTKEGNEDDRFLLNYVLNKGWVDQDLKRVPCYDEVVDEEDTKNDEVVDKFEESYNFRYEEP